MREEKRQRYNNADRRRGRAGLPERRRRPVGGASCATARAAQVFLRKLVYRGTALNQSVVNPTSHRYATKFTQDKYRAMPASLKRYTSRWLRSGRPGQAPASYRDKQPGLALAFNVPPSPPKLDRFELPISTAPSNGLFRLSAGSTSTSATGGTAMVQDPSWKSEAIARLPHAPLWLCHSNMHTRCRRPKYSAGKATGDLGGKITTPSAELPSVHRACLRFVFNSRDAEGGGTISLLIISEAVSDDTSRAQGKEGLVEARQFGGTSHIIMGVKASPKKTEYSKQYRGPRWADQRFLKLWEDNVDYRVQRRRVEHSHTPWAWARWDNGDDTDSSSEEGGPQTVPIKEEQTRPPAEQHRPPAEPIRPPAEPRRDQEVQTPERWVSERRHVTPPGQGHDDSHPPPHRPAEELIMPQQHLAFPHMSDIKTATLTLSKGGSLPKRETHLVSDGP
ncbi:hypothetical protein Bbelb_165940 [Branchiostoma belcheri]|nr:hypothetical protein Bbelb_165940 [Branchiostoma belcheri]